MKIMKKAGMILGMALGATVLGGGLANASSIDYQLSFTKADGTSSGTGSFLWDTATNTMTGLSWSVSGDSGTATDAWLASTLTVPHGATHTYGQWIYDFIVQPQTFSTTNASFSLQPGASEVLALGISTTANPGAGETPVYFLEAGASILETGYVTASEAVPEPASVALLLTGLGLGGMLRRRNSSRR